MLTHCQVKYQTMRCVVSVPQDLLLTLETSSRVRPRLFVDCYVGRGKKIVSEKKACFW